MLQCGLGVIDISGLCEHRDLHTAATQPHPHSFSVFLLNIVR